MKFLSFAVLFLPSLVSASSFRGTGWTYEPNPVVVAGVTYNCLKPAKSALIRDFAIDEKDREEIAAFKRYLDHEGDQYFCRFKKQPSRESFTWGDGSGFTSIEMRLSEGKCVVVDSWSGQDDGDSDFDFAANCF